MEVNETNRPVAEVPQDETSQVTPVKGTIT